MLASKRVSSAAREKVDTVVIGAGVIGLAIARALSRHSQDVFVLEQASTVASETSSRNSGVIHAGLYYETNSLKAQFCLRGRQLLYDYARERHVGHQQIGKLIVPTNCGVSDGEMSHATVSDEQIRRLHKLYQQALRNGVDDVRIIERDEVLVMEPELSLPSKAMALFSPSTGTIDVHELCQNLWADAEESGATIALSTPVLDARLIGGTVHLQTPGLWLECNRVINCAGLHSDALARKIHTSQGWQPPKQRFCKGNYFRLVGSRSPFSRLVYPLPGDGGLGIHATLDLGGHIRFGPDTEWLSLDQKPDEIDYRPSPDRVTDFERTIRSYWAALPNNSLEPDYSGVRPKLECGDFGIFGPSVHGVPGLYHCFGMESPGLTSSLAIAEYVADRIQ